MDAHGTDKVFAGSIPELYDTYLVPLIFESYAADLAGRAASWHPKKVLEIAAGTGVVTRALASALPRSTATVATDLNQPMLDRAQAVAGSRPVEWRQADAMQLPFEDGQFDLVVCQFGVMFFPEKPRAFAEARRVLAPRHVPLQRLGSDRGKRVRAHRHERPGWPLSRSSPSVPGPNATWVPRTADYRAGPAARWLPYGSQVRDRRLTKSRGLCPHPGDRLLPGNALAQ